MTPTIQHTAPRDERVLGVLGPTNTGKTHFAVERMLAHKSGMIGLPLRLLAREVFDRVVAAKGADAVALVTGEEKIVPRAPSYWVCTVESMPAGLAPECLAVDEIQMCADPERGHIFTDRLLHARGTAETLFMGAESMRGLIQRLVPHAQFVSRPRFSDLAYTGAQKLTRLPRRSAVVAFSAAEVYEIAELIRRQRGGAAVVMGALSPRTRNAQVALYQSGDVDFLIATDAIGMGLNMDVDHVAFASLEKFDGAGMRPLRAQELAQIAGRAGRHMKDGTFGVTGEAPAIDPIQAGQIENHRFEPVRMAQWRNAALDFASLEALTRSLEALPVQKGLQRARPASDQAVLQIFRNTPEAAARATSRDVMRLLWETCQVPDFRKVTLDSHAQLLLKLFDQLSGPAGAIDPDWLRPQVEGLDATEGEIDTIQARLAHIRTWTYVANRPGWLNDAAGWQERTRAIEDKLSDALHEKLTQRFIDRRTSVLMKRLRTDEEFDAAVSEHGEVLVEGEYIGRLEGLRFAADPRALGLHGRALKTAAFRGLQGEIAARAFRIANAADTDFELTEHGRIWWEGAPIAQLEKGHAPLRPRLQLLTDEQLTPTAWARAEGRLKEWLDSKVGRTLKPLFELAAAAEHEGGADMPAAARGFAFRLTEAFGVLDRETVRREMESLDPAARQALRSAGLRFGRFSIFLPSMLRADAARLKALLQAVWQGFTAIPPLPKGGPSSTAADANVPASLYAAAGYRLLGPRAVRLDMLERIGDLIESKRDAQKRLLPFAISPDMLSLLGCSVEDMAGVLRALHFRSEPAMTESGAEILLWRAKRRDEGGYRPAPRHDHAKPRPQAVQGEARAQGEAATAEAEAGDARERRKPRRRRPRPEGERRDRPTQVVRAEASGTAPPRAERPPRNDAPRNPAKPENRKAERRPDERRPDERRPDERRRPPRPQEHFSTDKRGRDKPPDPDSPFAVLAKLKPQG